MSSVGSKAKDRLKRFAESLEKGEKITERFTCRTIKLNLQPQIYSPELVKETREKLHSSQAIFSQFLGLSTSIVQDWEQGIRSPSGIACRLMDEIRRDPDYWIGRLKELSKPVEA